MLALMLVIIVVMAVATYTRFYFVSWIGERVTADLRRAVFDHLLRLPPGWFEVTRTGEVISRLTNDTAMLRNRDRLERVDGGAQSAAADRRARDARDHQHQADAARAGSACRSSSRRSCSSGAGCESSRARARIGWATSAPTSTRRCTRSAPFRPTATKRSIGGDFGERVEAAFETARAADPPARVAGRGRDRARLRRDRRSSCGSVATTWSRAASARVSCPRSCSTR